MKVFVCPSPSEMGKFRGVRDAFSEIWKGNILDVGCRSRTFKQVLSEKINMFAYYGVDLQPPADVIANIENLPFHERAFDVVVALDVLEHANDIHKAFGEVCRTTNRFVVLTLPNLYEIKKRIKFLLGLKLSGKFGLPGHPTQDRHRWFFSLRDAVKFVHTMAVRYKFEVAVDGCLIGPHKSFWFFRKMVGLFPNLLCSYYVVLLKRRI